MKLTNHPDGSYQVWEGDRLAGGVVSAVDGGWYFCDVDGYLSGSAPTRGEAARQLIERTKP